MRHARRRRPRVRVGRVVAAGASALTVLVAVLGAAGVYAVRTPDNVSFALADSSVSLGGRPVREDGDRRSTGSPHRKPLSRVGASNPRPSAPPARTPTANPATPTAAPTPTRPARPTPDPHEPIPALSGKGKRVVYRLATNHVWLVDESGRVVRSYLVSGTKFGQVKPGTYDVIRKRRHTTSYHGDARMEYMVTFTFGKNAAIGFHNIPVYIENRKPVQTTAQLGQSLSDGCVRQRTQDARALWDFAPVGTPVIVLR